ncbi:MAG: IclR family transcriptional regulator [Pigmentiphaga sp.]|uniref:IclR family transcriptional regulator n=1 Tax=Pigmentiphaga sp. TaxID=1977564 RepID=UPI0029A49686|nr:IclR family transcriptional regulator [Pigmentiphaga sp.]MDX3904275.1 IclR family transcriptional regulator [Pigmentiphaga sp.]
MNKQTASVGRRTGPPAASPPAGAQLLERAFRILRALSSRRSGWRLSELAEYCQLHHATVHRILAALLREEMVARIPHTQYYTLGRLAFEFGVAAAPRHDWRSMGGPSLDRLAGETGDTAFLNIRSGHESVCVDRREGGYPLKALTVEVGARRPLCVSAGGAAILAGLPPDEVAAVFTASAAYLGRFSPDRLASMRRMVETSRALGYGYNGDMIIPGVSAVGVAVRDFAGRPVAALSVAAATERLSGPRLEEVVDLLRAEAARIDARLAAR